MPDKDDIKIGNELRRITGIRVPVMSGVVAAVDSDDNTCTVKLTSGDDDTPADGILLNVVLGNIAGVYGLPAENANCLVAEVDGPGMWELIKADNYTKVFVTGSTLIQLNDGALGGLTIIGKLNDNLKAIHDYIKNTLEPAIKNAFTAVGAGGAASGPNGATSLTTSLTGQDITYEDMENTKIKQG